MKTTRYRGSLVAGATAVVLLTTLLSPVRAEDAAPMFPFVISYDGPDNASSMAHLLEAPAGKHGFVRVKDGHFANDAGPIRFHATNLTGPANFPTHERADKLAERMARLGINCVRLHFMDTWYINFMPKPTQAILADDTRTKRDLDAAQLEKLDYMIAAFKKRGIYVDMNLHVGRTLDERDGFKNSAGLPWANKGIGQFEPRMIELQKEYAKKLLTHVNPHTGNAYTDEPSVAMIEISNEDSLTRLLHDGTLERLPNPYATELRNQWNTWLHKTYANPQALREAWKFRPEPLHDQQIPDGRFDAPVDVGGKTWSFEKGSGEGSAHVDGGVLKVDVTKDGGEFHAKVIRRLAVKKGQLYTLSFRIRRTQGADPWRLSVAVATSSKGWRSLGLAELESVGSEWKRVTYVFEGTDDAEQAHLQLTRFKVGSYELDDLSFQAGADVALDPTKGYADGSTPIVGIASGFFPTQARRDFIQFLFDTEAAYWTGMAGHIKTDLKAKQPVSGTQLGYSPADIQTKLDYVDNHAYWRHPSGGWISLTAKEPWMIENDSMVGSLYNIFHLAGQRVHGKPYTISEYNHPYPNQYGAEGQVMLSVYGRLQGWDGVFQYSYNHYVDDFEPQANPWCFFDCIARTDVLAHFPACAAIFIRGDVEESTKPVVAAVDMLRYRERLLSSRSTSVGLDALGFDGRLPVMHKTALSFAGDGLTADDAPKAAQNQKTFVSDTGQITWNRDMPGGAYLAVNAPNARLFTGFPAGRTIALGDATLTPGKLRLDWATVSLVSRHGTGFGQKGKPASILLAATGASENSGRMFKQLDGKKITLPDRGGPPVLAEGIPAVITLPSDPAHTRCFALDPGGKRKKDVPVEKAENGGSKITIGPLYETVWYEIEIR